MENTQNTDMENTQNTDTENTQNTDMENTQNTDTENIQNTDIENTQNTDMENTQNTDTENTQNTDIENTQNTDTKNKTVFTDIGLNNIASDFKITYLRNRGTIGQLVYSLDNMMNRLNNPTNDYQNVLYPKIQSECKNLVDEYNKLVSEVDSGDYYLVGYYLNGSRNNGKRKATSSYYEKKSYSMSEYKETLKSINDRLRHIKRDCLRKTQNTMRQEQEVLERMVVFCDEYHKVIKSHLESWNEFITELRNTNGFTKKLRVKKQTRGQYTNNRSSHKIYVKRKHRNNDKQVI
jgi:hypothetical protein